MLCNPLVQLLLAATCIVATRGRHLGKQPRATPNDLNDPSIPHGPSFGPFGPHIDPAKTPPSDDGGLLTLDEAIKGPNKALYRNFKPYLEIIDGCDPFPAVDPYGKVSDGMKSDGMQGCSNPDFQAYARVARPPFAFPTRSDGPAIMYAWYFPKTGLRKNEKHDWQQIIVWLHKNHTVSSISFSQPKGYKSLGNPPRYGGTKRPLVALRLIDGGRGLDASTFQGKREDYKGRDSKVIVWDVFTTAAKEALGNDKNFAGKVAPFADSEFAEHLEAASKES